MSVVFSKEGFRSLRWAWLLLVVAIGAAAGIAVGSHFFLEKEKRDGQAATRALSDAQSRVEEARLERDNLASSAQLFRGLVGRGILEEESRLDLIERLDRLKDSHRLLGLDYEIAAQRPLPLPTTLSLSAVEVMGSRVTVSVKALHEGDALAFLWELVNPKRGFNPMSRCNLRKVQAGAVAILSPRVEAECTLEWISLRSKEAPRAK